eukprot:501581_1
MLVQAALIYLVTLVTLASGKVYVPYADGTRVNGISTTDTGFMSDRCAEQGMVPATIDNDEEDLAFTEACRAIIGGTNDWCFLGLYRSDPSRDRTQWQNSDGSTVMFTKWGGTEGTPQGVGGEQCVVIRNDNRDWHDYGCQSSHPLLCQEGTVDTNTECARDATTFDWDKLTTDGIEQSPQIDVIEWNINVDETA